MSSLVYARAALALFLLAGLAACGSTPRTGGSSGGYVSSGRSYDPPGPASDPWGPYIREAARRFDVPDRWIREVMRQESAGRATATSPVGAMGLMQVMPATYEELRQRHGLGDDPFDPHENMLAGTAYLRDMYNRFGAPGFLAAYNAGPNRLESYLGGGNPLPDETVNYVAAIAPRLGPGTNLTGPLAVYGASYDAGLVQPVPVEASAGSCDPDAAYDPARRCVEKTPAPQPTQAAAIPAPKGDWQVQVGAFRDLDVARDVAQSARALTPDLLGAAMIALPPTAPFGGTVLYRARLAGLSAREASDACEELGRQRMACQVVNPEPRY